VEKNIVFQSNIDPKFYGESNKSFVWGDCLRFQQIVGNLTSNAIKYTPPGGRVSLTFEYDESFATEQKTCVRITVSDTGIGIPSNEMGKIFLPFYQVTRSDRSTTSNSGAGVGLFIVSEIMKALGAEITCTSSTMGTTFVLQKLMFDFANQNDLQAHDESHNFWNDADPGLVHILLAEDNKLNQIVLKKLVERSGFRCTLVNDGQECVDTWKTDRDKFSLILMDLQMPVKDGLQATKEIRELENQQRPSISPLSRIPIVALTATTYPVEIERALASGMDECLSKPLTRIQLEECIFGTLKARNRLTSKST